MLVTPTASQPPNPSSFQITMPDTKFSTVKLDVNRKELLVQAPKFLLALPLTVRTASERRGDILKSLKDLYLKATARIWP